ncbi:MAG: patatin-like phospholipase family protein [Defluviitaleaceae bacterium]|nr:patatin-like phospholipase family protein [Defluviitaleaceae bacterium]
MEKSMRLGLALSGGGIRAAVYHLGMLARMAESGIFSKITSISSVSGASLCIALIFAVNGNRWPSTLEFLQKALPTMRHLILEENIQRAALIRLPFSPSYWNNRVEMLAKMLESMWGITGSLQDLPPFPFWEVNCTTFETGSRFRFRKDYMGDPKIGYVQKPNLLISHVVAASAAFPVFVGPYELETSGLRFTSEKFGGHDVDVMQKYTLWDGGVYDNLGLDALHKIGGGLDDQINYLVVSNASAPLDYQSRGRPTKNLQRLIEISSAQIDAIRTRDFFTNVVRKRRGRYHKISVAYPTTLNSPTKEDFDTIFKNGYDNFVDCYEN